MYIFSIIFIVFDHEKLIKNYKLYRDDNVDFLAILSDKLIFC